MTRLLIVDCDDRINERLQEMFVGRGFYTYGTWSGQEALKLLELGEFDVLLVDDYLPDLYTGEFLERITQLPVQPGIVVMHRSSLRDQQLEHCKSLGLLTVDKTDPVKVYAAVIACRDGMRFVN
jgi:CheY-like chemotaxis protein